MNDDLLLWQDFDRKNIDLPEEVPGLERFNENRFVRQYTVLRYAHLSSRIITLDKSFQLPFNSILHVLDDVNNTDENHSDVPDVKNNELITRESSRKYIYHIKSINTDGPIEINDKFIFRIPGLPTKLMAFRNEYGSKFRYINDISQMPKTKEPLLIVNHNPLFRVRLYGRMRFYRKIQIVLSSILNTCAGLSSLNKHQFIMIPWGTEVYPRTEFIKSRKELSFTSIKHPDSFHYLIMMHLMNYMWDQATTSIFDKLSSDVLNQITLVLQSKDKYIFMNLGTIKSFNENNRAYIKFSNQLNLLSVLGRDNPEAATEYLESIKESEETSNFTDISVLPNIKGSPDKSISDDEHAESIIEKLDVAIPNKVTKKVTPVSIEVPAKSVAEIELSKGDTKVAIKKLHGQANVSKIEEFSTVDNYAKEWIKTLDTEADANIDKNEALTPASKNYFKKLARKYKTCTIDGESILDLMSIEDMALTDSTVDLKKVGFLPDTSAASSTLASFEKDYMKKSYKKHLASVLTSFQKNGLFLTNVRQEKVIDTLHNYTVYSAQYEDLNSTKSTIKFVLPNVNSEDRFITDGKSSVLKKQRCPLPIVKISPTTVSLCSNYNKTRVIRNTNKAYHFIDYISSFIDNKAKTTAKVVYGSLHLNEPISYEYTELASKFKHIDLFNKVKYHLTFDYFNRFNEFDKDEKLFIKLEATYGTYFGYTDTDYLFIDTDNTVYAYKKTGGEDVSFEYSSIVDILKLSLLPGASIKKNFSEFVTCQILNGNLPVIFILAYRYGLRNTLDYLGIPYTIVANDSREIVGEATPATESYIDSMPGANPYGLGWIPNPTKEGGEVSNPTDIHDETDVIIDSDTRGSKYILPQDENATADDKITDVKIYVSPHENRFIIEAVTVSVKLGMLRTVVRRVSSFDGVIFHERDNKLPVYLANSLANTIRCKSDKVIQSQLIHISTGNLPREVKEAKEMPIQSITTKNVSQENFISGMEAIKDAKYKKKSNDIVIKFADRTLHINRYPLALSLIVAGLNKYDLTPYRLADMEDKDVYFRILAESGDKPNLLKGIDSMFDLFIDPITYQVLKSMHEPTTFRDLLIRATVLLTTTDHKEPSSAANHRVRGYEQFPAILYNEMARQFAAYQTKKHQKGNVYSINPQAIYLRVIQNESTMPGEAANPLEDIKIASNLTYSGIGGRDGESFVKSDRKMSADDVGIISEATADSGKVGMNAMLSFNPRIKNTQGLITPCTKEDLKDMQPSECLSIHTLVMPFASSDDAKRMNFVSIQGSHTIPTEHSDVYRVRTGYERVVAHRVTKTFAGIAQGKGKVTRIDENAKLVEVTYTDGKVDLFKFGDQIVEAESIGILQHINVAVQVGQPVEKGDVITYNTSFFKQDPVTKQLDMSIGVTANVAFIECDMTNEDSFQISKECAEKMAIAPVNSRDVVLSTKALIHSAVDIGEEVTPSSPLMIFENEALTDTPADEDPEVLALLSDVNRSTPKAKHSGKVVRIDAYFGCPIDQMSPTVAKLVRKCISSKVQTYKLAKETGNESEFQPVTPIQPGNKFHGVMFDEDTLLLVYHIQERIPHGVGDKLVVANQLKCTCASVFENRPVSESGVPIDLIFSQKAQNNRICVSPIQMGIISRIMEQTEKDVVAEYFG